MSNNCYKLLLIFVTLFVFFGCGGDNQTIYVSPSGNDSASGSKSNPLKSLRAACDKARKMRQSTSFDDSKPIVIMLKAGTYQALRPIVLTKEDSGTEKSPLIIRGEDMNNTVISGGIELPPFVEESTNLWSIDLQQTMPSGGEIQQLFVNGKRATRARTPNDDKCYMTGKIEEQITDLVPERNATRTGVAVQKVRIPADAVQALQKSATANPLQMKISFYHAWDITRRYVQSFSVEDSTLFVTGGRMKSWNRMDRCSQFILEDDISFLDVPGEWFYDAAEAKLYYIPRDGETTADSKVLIPVAQQLIILKGTENNHVANIRFENISLQHTRYTMTWRGNEPQQAAASTAATVEADFASNIFFDNCEIAHTGNNAIWIRKACRDSKITHCYFHDLGIGAVKIGDIPIPQNEDLLLTKNITVDNNILCDGGHVFPTGVGITLFQASDNTITHNEVFDFYYSGMSIGWLWGYNHSPSKRNKILYNHIHHIGWGLLSDMGGVYTLGPSEGTEVSHNVIHHIYSLGYGGWGLYTDEGSTGIKMENNLVYNCKSSGFHQHYGKENLIRNNIFVNNIRAQLEATRTEEHISYTFSNNIIYYTQGNMYGINWDKPRANVEENLYWHEGGEVSFNDLTLEEWQKKTDKDKNSIIEDPGFKDIKNGDFTMSNTAALQKIHFTPFDYGEAGIYGDETWRKLAEYDKNRAMLFDETVDWYEINSKK